MSKLAYTLDEAADATGFSVKTLRRAIGSTDPAAFPPPLDAKRAGDAPNAPYRILAPALVAWLDSMKDA